MTITMAAPAVKAAGGPQRRLRPWLWATAGITAAAGAFGILWLDPTDAFVVIGALGGLVLFLACVRSPIVGTYVYLGTLFFIAGIDRGNLIPLVRPNEALLALVVGGALVGGYLRLCRGDPWPLRAHPIDVPLAGFFLLSTAWPIASLLLRGMVPSGAELAAVLPICKLVGLFLLVRCTVTSEARLRHCLRLIIWTGAGVSLIAILQTLQVGPVVAALATLWEPGADVADLEDRGSTTLSSPIATGDVIVICLIIIACCAARRVLPLRELVGLGFVLACGALAAGQFSTWISALVAIILLVRLFPEARRWAVRALPILPIALVIGAPALTGRLTELAEIGVPVSWQGRWDNLSNFFVPAFEPLNWLIGVSPDPVLDAPETWRELIYLEAGYLAFLWVGGLPLLAGFIWLSVAVLRSAKQAMDRRDAFGATAVALHMCWSLLLVITVLDPHLTLRGTGDLLFTMLAVTTLAATRGSSVDRQP
jgi:hypothetical protein